MWAFKQQEKGPSHPNISFLELLNHAEHGEDMMDTDELNIYDLYEPQQLAVSPHRVRASSASGDRSKLARPKSSIGRIETRRQSRLPKGVLLYEEDYLLARFVKEGDRVRIKKSGVQILGEPIPVFLNPKMSVGCILTFSFICFNKFGSSKLNTFTLVLHTF